VHGVEDEGLMVSRRKDAMPFSFRCPDEKKPMLAIIIDDMGESLEQISPFLDLAVPITFSILPNAKGAKEVAGMLSRLGVEYMLHIPMEPNDPDMMESTRFLLTGMNAEDLRARLQDFLEKVGGAPKGANNHMGSRFTTDREGMRIVLEVLKERGLFFLDSRTTKDSVAREVAKETGVCFGERDVFLDSDVSEASISNSILHAVIIAKSKGFAIAIGHPRLETLSVLRRFVGTLDGSVALTFVSCVLRCPEGQP
jgi:polysaccharide deacetylase 2 family uncharacterized protein YibQ